MESCVVSGTVWEACDFGLVKLSRNNRAAFLLKLEEWLALTCDVVAEVQENTDDEGVELAEGKILKGCTGNILATLVGGLWLADVHK